MALPRVVCRAAAGWVGAVAAGCAVPNPNYVEGTEDAAIVAPSDAARPATVAPGPRPDGGQSSAMTVLVSSTADNARYNFEVDEQGWKELHAQALIDHRTTTRSFRGQASLQVDLNLGAGEERFASVFVPETSGGAGTSITFRVWLPKGNALEFIQPYALYFPVGATSATDVKWAGQFHYTSVLPSDTWGTYTVVVPSDARGLYNVGVQFHSQSGWKGTVYIDSVNY